MSCDIMRKLLIGFCVLLLLTTTFALSVSRSFSSPVNPNANILITLTINVDSWNGLAYGIEETFPQGFTLINPGTGTANNNTIRWVDYDALQGNYTLTYTIKSSSSGTYSFSGIYQFEGLSSSTITGNTSIIVNTPVGAGTDSILNLGLAMDNKAIAAEITCLNDSSNASLDLNNLDGESITGVTITDSGGAPKINGSLECKKGTLLKYLLKSDNITEKNSYMVTARITTPCNICTRQAVIYYPPKTTESNVPDNNYIAIILVFTAIITILSKTKKP
jgi:hypothetical protein